MLWHEIVKHSYSLNQFPQEIQWPQNKMKQRESTHQEGHRPR